jgi:hypothetical protein
MDGTGDYGMNATHRDNDEHYRKRLTHIVYPQASLAVIQTLKQHAHTQAGDSSEEAGSGGDGSSTSSGSSSSSSSSASVAKHEEDEEDEEEGQYGMLAKVSCCMAAAVWLLLWYCCGTAVAAMGLLCCFAGWR